MKNILAALAVLGAAGLVPADEIIVAPSGGDYASIQAALNVAEPGDTVSVRSGVYNEKLTFPASGNATNGSIVLRAYPGESPALDGQNVPGQNMMLLEEKSYIRISGFEIRNNTNVTDGSGIRLLGACRHIEILNNVIHAMRYSNAMGITVYGTNSAPASNLVIQANEIYDCQAAESEALTLNGNVTHFDVSSNAVHDVNNIGIDFIGGETDVSAFGVCRNGVCRDNHVYRCRSSYGGGYAAGIYVDGGRDILIERNRVHECDFGMEIGAENAGYDATGIVVRSNLIFLNDKAGLSFGGYEAAVGRTRNCRFIGNTCYQNDQFRDPDELYGELCIQYASNNVVQNNLFYSGASNVLIGSAWEPNSNVGNVLDYNLFFTPSGNSNLVSIVWNDTEYSTFQSYRSGTGQDAHSLWANPQFLDAAQSNFHVSVTSAAVNAGNPAYPYSLDEKDLDGEPRVMGDRIDAGADENSGYRAWRDASFKDTPGYWADPEAFLFSRGGDYDMDSDLNNLEFHTGTIPTNPASRLDLSIRADPAGVEIAFLVRSNRDYAIQRSADLAAWADNGAHFWLPTNAASYRHMDARLTNCAAYRLSVCE